MSFSKEELARLRARFLELMAQTGNVTDLARSLGINRNTAFGWARKAGLRSQRRQRPHPAPNEFTPLPGGHPAHRWAVVSEALRAEARGYPTPLEPVTVPNVLPETPPEGLQDRHTEFLEQIGAAPGRPLLLVPVRVFRVKGVEISVRLFSRMRQVSREQGRPDPLLLVFGDLGEDPDYTEEVLDEAAQEGVLDHVRFLDGVPLQSHRGTGLRWYLDEIDLLRVSAATGGGVLFTPNRPDVESVGLGSVF
ncbi:hypothetical protein ACFWTE_08460 [Nocardiopsis sp. NPDC058631]|uniref:hypothetical protein n=1 Tax=Nocardiopsis sp. NPDC058631 TaxID=3346566 RepID=UPI003666F8C1